MSRADLLCGPLQVGGIDAEGEQTQVAGVVVQNLFNVVDGSLGTDGLDLDAGAGCGVVGILSVLKAHAGLPN